MHVGNISYGVGRGAWCKNYAARYPWIGLVILALVQTANFANIFIAPVHRPFLFLGRRFTKWLFFNLGHLCSPRYMLVTWCTCHQQAHSVDVNSLLRIVHSIHTCGSIQIKTRELTGYSPEQMMQPFVFTHAALWGKLDASRVCEMGSCECMIQW